MLSYLHYIQEKISSDKYRGIWGKVYFFIRGIWFVLIKVCHKFSKYHIVPLGVEQKIRWIVKHLLPLLVKQNKIDLLLIQPNGLGDAVINKAYIDVIIKNANISPERILMLTSDAWQGFEQLLFKNIQVHFFNINKFERNLFYRFKIYYIIMKYNFDIALCNLRWKPHVVCDGLLFFANAKNAYSALTDERYEKLNECFKIWCNAMNINVIGSGGNIHEIDRLAFFYNSIFDFDIKIPPNRSIRAHLQRPSGENPVFAVDTKYIVFHIGVADYRRRWPIEKFTAVGDYFLTTGYTIVFAGGSQEKDIESAIEDRFMCYIDRLSPEEYAILLADASAILSGDTGPTHLAIALNAPTAILLGGGHFGNYFPYPLSVKPQISKIEYIYAVKDCYYCDWKCEHYSRFSCIHDITVDNAIDAINRLLQ